MEIGFIGLGNLGMPIAENILQKAHRLFIYNRTASKAQPLIEKGATMCSSIKELAQKSDVLFSVVSDDAALIDITRGNNGIAQNLKENGTITSCGHSNFNLKHHLRKWEAKSGKNFLNSP